jgi:hypothetical protein
MSFLPDSTAFPVSLADPCSGLSLGSDLDSPCPGFGCGGWMGDRLSPQPATLRFDETLGWDTRGINPPIADWVIEPTGEGEGDSGLGTGGVGLGSGQPSLDRTANRYDSLNSAIDWGFLGSSTLQQRNRLDASDRLDYYRLSLDHASRLQFGLESIVGPAPTITVLDAQGVAIETSKRLANGVERQIDLARGDYYLKVTAPDDVVSSDYQLKASAQSIAEWSMLVYIAADNNLEAYGLQDFLEMAEVGSTRDVTIAVTLDRAKGYSTDYGDWTSTKRGLVQKGDRPTATWGKDLGEQNMGSARTLSNFLAWGLDAAPALRYELVLWNHGGGWNRIATDETSLGDALTATEITTALAPTPKLDIIGADACYMGMVEFAYQLRSEADYFVGASAAEQAEGWNYSTLLRDLNANPIANARTVAESIVTSDRRQTANWTLSAIDLASLDNLNQSINQLVDSLIRPIGSAALTPTQANPIVKALQSARSKSLAFGADSLGFRDLGQLLQELAGNSSLTAKQRSAARSAQARYGETIVANSSSKGATGLSIYAPSIGSLPIDSRYNASNQQFAANGRWDELLQWWQTNANPGRSMSPVPGQVATVSATGIDRLEIESGEIESGEIERLGMA